MAGGTDRPADGGAAAPGVGEIGRGVFLAATAHGVLDARVIAEELSLSVDEVTAAAESLLRLRLLREEREEGTEGGGTGGGAAPGARLVPVDPHAAAAEIAVAFERSVRHRRETVHRTLATVRALAEEYEAATAPLPGAAPGLELVLSAEAVRRRLAEETDRCRTEALTVQPGGARSRSTLSEARPRDLSMLARGVRMRILYQHTARASLTTQSYARAVTAAGAQVRTLGALTERIILLDRRIAFIPVRERHDSPPGAAVITEPHLVGFLHSVYELMWHQATPFDPNAAGEYHAVPDEIRRELLRGLAAGMKDEVISRRLGMSVRTCRRHIAELMNELQVTSRFQAGMAATRLGWLDHLAEDPGAER